MKQICRVGDSSTGHGPYPPNTAISGDDLLLVDGRPAVCVGDGWSTHCKPPPNPNCHGGSTASGSSVLFVNGKAVARVGDSISCGGAVATGSETMISK